MKWLVGISIVLACLALAVVGLYIDAKGFLLNLLAGVIVLILTVTLVDRLLKTHQKKEWQTVRQQIISALTWHLGNIAGEYMINFRGHGFDLIAYAEDVGAGYEEPLPKTSVALTSMVKKMETSKVPDNARELCEHVYGVIKWDIEQIRLSILPRIIAIGSDEPELAALLGDLDNAGRKWRNEIIMDQEISSGDQYSEAVNTLRAASKVYTYLSDRVEGRAAPNKPHHAAHHSISKVFAQWRRH